MKRTVMILLGVAFVAGIALAFVAGVQGAPASETDQKVVPILSAGKGLRIGAALVAGEKDQVDKVKAVAQLETEIGNRIRARVLVPVESENVIEKIRRVPGTSVIAYADLKI